MAKKIYHQVCHAVSISRKPWKNCNKYYVRSFQDDKFVVTVWLKLIMRFLLECQVCGYVASNWHADLKDWNGFYTYKSYKFYRQVCHAVSISSKVWKNCNKYYVRSFSGWQVCGYLVVKVYYEISPKVGITRLWLLYVEKVIMKNKNFYYRPDRNGISRFFIGNIVDSGTRSVLKTKCLLLKKLITFH